MESWRRDGEMLLVSFPALEREGAAAVFTSRQGGASSFPYASLNLALHTGDVKETVLKNRFSLAMALDLQPGALISPEQVHGDGVAQVTAASFNGPGPAPVLPGADALITKLPGVYLTAYFADCVPLYFLDPAHRAVGLAHAGWRGTALDIGRKTLAAMGEAFGTEPAACLAVVGPGIGPCCYEVGAEVVERLANLLPGLEGVAWREGEGYRLDLKKANARLLLKAGIEQPRLTVSRYCTSCRPDLFYSYRRDGVTGRMAAVLGLKE